MSDTLEKQIAEAEKANQATMGRGSFRKNNGPKKFRLEDEKLTPKNLDPLNFLRKSSSVVFIGQDNEAIPEKIIDSLDEAFKLLNSNEVSLRAKLDNPDFSKKIDYLSKIACENLRTVDYFTVWNGSQGAATLSFMSTYVGKQGIRNCKT